MIENPESLERLLRQAPVPRPPAELKALLLQKLSSTAPRGERVPLARPAVGGFWSRRWPLLVPGITSLALASLVAVQQAELKRMTAPSSAPTENSDSAGNEVPAAVMSTNSNAEVGTGNAVDERTELERLRQQVRELTEAIASANAMATEKDSLEARLAAEVAALPPELQELSQMRDRARRIQCVNNLKQIGLAVRIYAHNQEGNFPSSLLILTNELGHNFRMLVCPDDESRPAAKDAATLTAANCSYEFLAPGPGRFETEVERVMARCPIHGNVALCDGSVQQLSPERLKNLKDRDGRSYLNEPNADLAPAQP